jgi:hypothetical protein
MKARRLRPRTESIETACRCLTHQRLKREYRHRAFFFGILTKKSSPIAILCLLK